MIYLYTYRYIVVCSIDVIGHYGAISVIFVISVLPLACLNEPSQYIQQHDREALKAQKSRLVIFFFSFLLESAHLVRRKPKLSQVVDTEKRMTSTKTRTSLLERMTLSIVSPSLPMISRF